MEFDSGESNCNELVIKCHNEEKHVIDIKRYFTKPCQIFSIVTFILITPLFFNGVSCTIFF